MKKIKLLFLFLFAAVLFNSCAKEDINDNPTPKTDLPGEEPTDQLELEIKDFEWKAMNYWYLFKDNVAVLDDDYFSTQTDLNAWLADWDTPEDLFYDGLLFDYPVTDRFSWIVDDYEELENEFAGISETDGINFKPFILCDGCTDVGIAVRYVAKGSPADAAGIKRGMIYTEVDGQKLNVNNYADLTYYNTSLSVTYGFIDETDITGEEFGPVVEEIDLTKTIVEENPIYIAKTFDINGKTVGYLMYNSFVHDYDDELNDAFGKFKDEGVTELILDLRYNLGGRGSTAVDLGSMINLQLEGKIFLKEKYNSFITQAYIDQYGDEALITRFDNQIYEYDASHPEHVAEPINSLNLNKVYIIATGSSYSASEILINGLKPHMDVVQIGTATGGKFQGSLTLYDSNNFRKDGSGLNPDHKYALQPLVASNTNVNGEAYPDGLIPNVEQKEFISSYGTLGDPDEPLLKTALDLISGASTRGMIQDNPQQVYGLELQNNMIEDASYKKFSLDGLAPPLNFD